MQTKKLAVVPPALAASSQLFWRTLLLKNTAVGDDVADHVDAQTDGTAVKFVGLLRKTITEDLKVRVKKQGVAFCTLTIPIATPVDTLVQTTAFTPTGAVTEGDVFSWDVTGSDGQIDAAGVATFTLYMRKAA